MMTAVGGILGYYAYQYLATALTDDRKSRIMDYSRILTRWNEYQREDFSKANFEMAFNEEKLFLPMRKEVDSVFVASTCTSAIVCLRAFVLPAPKCCKTKRPVLQ